MKYQHTHICFTVCGDIAHSQIYRFEKFEYLFVEFVKDSSWSNRWFYKFCSRLLFFFFQENPKQNCWKSNLKKKLKVSIFAYVYCGVNIFNTPSVWTWGVEGEGHSPTKFHICTEGSFEIVNLVILVAYLVLDDWK